MTIKRANPSWSDHWYRVVALAIVFGMLTMQVPTPVFACLSGDICNPSESCDSCDKGPAGLLVQSDVSCKEGTDSRANHSQQEVPKSQPCCPDGCTHCALSCCGGVLFLNDPLILTAGLLLALFPTTFQGSLPPSDDPLDIFHPPRT
jgi:hypothetical protein